jgi:hypothetical protein
MSCEDNVLKALKKRMRVTRKTAIERGWCENLTATISRLRRMGYNIMAVKATDINGEDYTRYRLLLDDLKQAA